MKLPTGNSVVQYRKRRCQERGGVCLEMCWWHGTNSRGDSFVVLVKDVCGDNCGSLIHIGLSAVLFSRYYKFIGNSNVFFTKSDRQF